MRFAFCRSRKSRRWLFLKIRKQRRLASRTEGALMLPPLALPCATTGDPAKVFLTFPPLQQEALTRAKEVLTQEKEALLREKLQLQLDAAKHTQVCEPSTLTW